MRFSQGSLGRVFVLRLEDGDVLNDALESFARDQKVARALLFYLGGTAPGSKLVVGPEERPDDAIVPIIHALAGARETLALGTLLPNERGEPVVHMHAATGREGDAIVGCTRAGVETWLVGEVVLLEILGTEARRELDKTSGFELLTLG
jgi:uncharacterized protein